MLKSLAAIPAALSGLWGSPSTTTPTQNLEPVPMSASVSTEALQLGATPTETNAPRALSDAKADKIMEELDRSFKEAREAEAKIIPCLVSLSPEVKPYDLTKTPAALPFLEPLKDRVELQSPGKTIIRESWRYWPPSRFCSEDLVVDSFLGNSSLTPVSNQSWAEYSVQTPLDMVVGTTPIKVTKVRTQWVVEAEGMCYEQCRKCIEDFTCTSYRVYFPVVFDQSPFEPLISMSDRSSQNLCVQFVTETDEVLSLVFKSAFWRPSSHSEYANFGGREIDIKSIGFVDARLVRFNNAFSEAYPLF